MAFECVNVMKCIDVIKFFFQCWYTWWFTDPINPGRSNRPSLSTQKSSVLLIQLDDMKNAIFEKKLFFRRKFWINKLPLINYTNLWVIPSLQILALTMSKVTLFWLVEKYHHTNHVTVGTKINSLKGGSFQFHDTEQMKEKWSERGWLIDCVVTRRHYSMEPQPSTSGTGTTTRVSTCQ